MSNQGTGIFDISVEAHRKRTGRDGRSSSGKSSALTGERNTTNTPARARAREDIIKPAFLRTLLPGMAQRQSSKPLDPEFDELRKSAAAAIPKLGTLYLNVLMLAESGLGTIEITQTLGIFERNVQTAFLSMYEELGMKDIAANKKRELLFSAWRAFAQKEASAGT